MGSTAKRTKETQQRKGKAKEKLEKENSTEFRASLHLKLFHRKFVSGKRGSLKHFPGIEDIYG